MANRVFNTKCLIEGKVLEVIEKTSKKSGDTYFTVPIYIANSGVINVSFFKGAKAIAREYNPSDEVILNVFLSIDDDGGHFAMYDGDIPK